MIVLLVTFLFITGSVGFVLSAQEWWSSKAKVTEPQPQDFSAYQSQVKQFQPVFNIYQDDGTVLISKELDKLVDSRVLFRHFINTLNSANNKRAFLDENSEFQSIKDNIGVDQTDSNAELMNALYSQWFSRINAQISELDNNRSPYFVSFQAKTQQSSFDLLTSYISATETKVQQDAYDALQAVINGKRNELVQQKKVIETQAKKKLLVEIKRTQYAAGVARAAGVESPIQIGREDELFGIDLGLKGLEAKVEVLKSIDNLSIIEPRLQQIEAKLDMLNNIEIDRDVTFQTFRFLENVEQPVTRDKPKRTLIVIFCAFTGLVFGIAIVLVRFSFKRK